MAELTTVPPGYHREGQYVVKDGESLSADSSTTVKNLPVVTTQDIIKAHFVSLTDMVGMSGMTVKKRVVVLSLLGIGTYMAYKKGLLKKVFKK